MGPRLFCTSSFDFLPAWLTITFRIPTEASAFREEAGRTEDPGAELHFPGLRPSGARMLHPVVAEGNFGSLGGDAETTALTYMVTMAQQESYRDISTEPPLLSAIQGSDPASRIDMFSLC